MWKRDYFQKGSFISSVYLQANKIKMLIASARHHFYFHAIFFDFLIFHNNFDTFTVSLTLLCMLAQFFTLRLASHELWWTSMKKKLQKKQSKIICLHKWNVAYQLKLEFALPFQREIVCLTYLCLAWISPHLSSFLLPHLRRYKFTAGIIQWDNIVFCRHKIFLFIPLSLKNLFLSFFFFSSTWIA